MFDAAIYHSLYHQTLLLLTLLTAIVYAQSQNRVGMATGYNAGLIWLFSLSFVIVIGTRPISGVYFVDMSTYAQSFEATASGRTGLFINDPGFNTVTEFCSSVMSVDGYFVVCALLYIVPVMVAVRLIHGDWAFAVLLSFAGGFSFYSYGVNGIRNGIATSILLVAFALHERRILMIALMALAISFHKSVAVPSAAFLACTFYASPAASMAVWLAAFIAALLFGESLSASLGGLISLGDDERLLNYTTGAGAGLDRGGFRLDFVLYSIVPVIIAYLLANVATRRDLFYRRLVCAYLGTNAFWLMMMYAAFSNRFAYLSWFMMPWIVIYPFAPRIKTAKLAQPEVASTWILPVALVAHYAFTYVMQMYVYQGRG